MKALKWIFGVVVVLAAIVLIWGAVIPKVYFAEAKITIDKPAMMLYQSVVSFNDRPEWDPWLETEPDATVIITTQPENGFVGSEYHWDGEVIGTGMMRVDSVELGHVIYNSLLFGDSQKPSLVTWTFTPMADSTQVSWTITAQTAYPIERIVFSLMGKGLIASFNKGLDNFKVMMDERPAQLSYIGSIAKTQMQGFDAAVAKGEATMEEMSMVMGQLYGKIMIQVELQKLLMNGAPFTYYDNTEANNETFRFYAGIPVNLPVKKRGAVEPMNFATRNVLSVMHMGPYEELGLTYQYIINYIAEKNIEVTGEVIEYYLNDPMDVAPEEIKTKIVYFLN